MPEKDIMETITATITRLDTLQDHTTFLSTALRTAQRRVVIVSPFISIRAINADNLAATMESLIKSKGLSVTVYTEATFNKDND